jgi:hypothetical protein
MPTKSEIVLVALETLLAGTGVKIERNIPIPTSVPVSGLIILLDGEPGEPEVTMSPLAYEYDHRAMAEVFVQKASGRETVLDGLKAAIGALLGANRTLGGLCLWVEAVAPKVEALPLEGAAPLLTAQIGIRLIYLTTDPLA